MIVAFTSFTISFVAILGMLLMKAREIKNQKKYFVSKIAVKTDNFFSEIFTNIKKLLSYINRHAFISLIQWFAYLVLSRARKVYIWAYNKAHEHPHSKKVIDMVRGKGDISKAGGASFYLKRISDNVYPVEGNSPSFVKK
jgi:hypothetical protein